MQCPYGLPTGPRPPPTAGARLCDVVMQDGSPVHKQAYLVLLNVHIAHAATWTAPGRTYCCSQSRVRDQAMLQARTCHAGAKHERSFFRRPASVVLVPAFPRAGRPVPVLTRYSRSQQQEAQADLQASSTTQGPYHGAASSQACDHQSPRRMLRHAGVPRSVPTLTAPQAGPRSVYASTSHTRGFDGELKVVGLGPRGISASGRLLGEAACLGCWPLGGPCPSLPSGLPA